MGATVDVGWIAGWFGLRRMWFASLEKSLTKYGIDSHLSIISSLLTFHSTVFHSTLFTVSLGWQPNLMCVFNRLPL
jgi:hypothetical protein